jgi:HK97 family phage prohead protease
MSKRPALHRTLGRDLEIRGDGRTLSGIAVPFNEPARIDGSFDETFVMGAFSRTIAERSPEKVKLLASHDASQFPIGHATSLREDPSGLLADFRVADTDRGNEALQLVRDGTLDSLSVGFVPISDNWSRDGRSRTVTEAKLLEVSLVSWPAYSGAVVTGVRSAISSDLSLVRARWRALAMEHVQ